MQLELGSTPAPGVPNRRPRRVPPASAESLKGEFSLRATNVTGEGTSHGARGGRGPLAWPSHSLPEPHPRRAAIKWASSKSVSTGSFTVWLTAVRSSVR